MQLHRPKFCQLETLQQKLLHASCSYVYKWCYTYTHSVYTPLGCTNVSPVVRFTCLRQRMYMTLTLVFDVCTVQDTMKRILILCFFTRAPAVSVFEFKRWNLFQRPASLYSLYHVLMLNLYVPTSDFSAFSFQLYWNAYYRCYRKELHTTRLHILVN